MTVEAKGRRGDQFSRRQGGPLLVACSRWPSHTHVVHVLNNLWGAIKRPMYSTEQIFEDALLLSAKCAPTRSQGPKLANPDGSEAVEEPRRKGNPGRPLALNWEYTWDLEALNQFCPGASSAKGRHIKCCWPLSASPEFSPRAGWSMIPRLRRITGYVCRVGTVEYLPESDSQGMYVHTWVHIWGLGDIGICFKGCDFSASCVCGVQVVCLRVSGSSRVL